MIRESVLLGTFFGLVSALGYSAANVCLRAVIHCDPMWVSCVKAMPTAVLLGVWLLFGSLAGRRDLPRGRFLLVVALSSLFMHVAGNVPFQWALSVIGVALTTSLTLGSIIITGAVLGRIYLSEPITPRAAAAIGVLGLAVMALVLGAGEASSSVLQVENEEAVSTWKIIVGVLAACLAGFAYGQLGVVIRHGLMRGGSIAGMLWTVSTLGVVILGMLTIARLGVSSMLDTSWIDLQTMLGAGLFTTVAFLTLAKALQLTTLIYINTLNASQAAMCAVAGVWFFNEPASVAMWSGVGLTAVGLVLMDRQSHRLQTPADLKSEPASSAPLVNSPD